MSLLPYYGLQVPPADMKLGPVRRGTLLSRSEPVTLVGETGGPVSSRFVLGEGYARTFRDSDGQFHVAAGRPALLELLTDPEIDSFRIHAEIRQDGFLSDAIVGVYYVHGGEVSIRNFRVESLVSR